MEVWFFTTANGMKRYFWKSALKYWCYSMWAEFLWIIYFARVFGSGKLKFQEFWRNWSDDAIQANSSQTLESFITSFFKCSWIDISGIKCILSHVLYFLIKPDATDTSTFKYHVEKILLINNFFQKFNQRKSIGRKND